jgi:hypothetical protein
MIIDDAITKAYDIAHQLNDAARAAAEAFDGPTESAVVREALHAAKLAHEAQDALARCRCALAHHRRPKGPMVILEWVGFGDKSEQVREVVRRTETFVFLRHPYGQEERYSMKDGEPPGGKATHSSRIRGFRTGVDRWRIKAEDLPAIMEMPVGENEVSRALRSMAEK